MTIQGMREGVKKHKILIGILFVLLIASLLITYSVSGLRNASLGTGQGADYSGFEEAVAQQREDLKANPDDYSANYSLANTLYEYATQLVNDDAATALTYYEEAGGLYLKALENAPADLNDQGKANMYSKAGACYSVAGNNEEAEKNFKAAVELAPADLDTNVIYARHLVSLGEYDAAQQVMTELVENADDEQVVASANSIIEQIKTAKDGAANAGTAAQPGESE